MSKLRVISRVEVGCLVMAMLAVGCSGGADFGESITIPQEQHTKVADAFGAGKALHLPTDMPFNVTDAQRFSQGDATAESAVDGAGKARCSARAGKDGSAWAEFELGQVLSNRGDKPFDTTATFNVTYSYRMAGGVSARSATPDKFVLKVYIMDSNRHVRRMMLAELDPAKGPTTWTGTQSPAFDVTFEPGLAYHLVLAGRVEVSGDEGRSPSAEIEVKSLEIEIVPKN